MRVLLISSIHLPLFTKPSLQVRGCSLLGRWGPGRSGTDSQILSRTLQPNLHIQLTNFAPSTLNTPQVYLPEVLEGLQAARVSQLDEMKGEQELIKERRVVRVDESNPGLPQQEAARQEVGGGDAGTGILGI